jgi:hypothetical protein
MESKESTTRHYDALILVWIPEKTLLLDSPPLDLLNAFKEVIDITENISLKVVDGTRFNLTSAISTHEYLTLVKKVIKEFNNPLLLLPFSSLDRVKADVFLARLIKNYYTRCDVAYIAKNQQQAAELWSTAFSRIFSFDTLVEDLTKAIIP